MNIPQLPVDHPWYFLSSIALPNVKWCEATMHSWVTEPANTWSNIAYIIVGAMIFRETKRSGIKNPFLKMFGTAAIVLAFCSGIYHASYNFITQVLDFIGMYFVFLVPLMINFQRLKSATNQTLMKAYYASVVLLTATTVAFYYMKIPIQLIVFTAVLLIVFTELKIRKRNPNQKVKYGSFGLSLGSLAAGGAFSVLDVTRTMCNPHNHFFQGHATWHFLSATCVYFAFKHYQQFETDPELSAQVNLSHV
jgi:hypothetical protein